MASRKVKAPEVFTIGAGGIGVPVKDPLPPQDQEYDQVAIGNKILSLVRTDINEHEEKSPPEKEESPLGMGEKKLYLYMIKKRIRNNLISLENKVIAWWRRETTNDLKDLCKNILIHGLLGASALLTLLTVLSVDIVLVDIVKTYMALTVLVYIFGAGSAYYLILDFNSEMYKTWGKKK